MDRYGRRALDFFARSHNQALDHPAFGEAQMARLRGDKETCIRKCREAFAAHPWLVEAKALEVDALRDLAVDQEVAGDYAARDRFTSQARKALAEGMARAPSDEALMSKAVDGKVIQSIRESIEGHASEQTFQEGEDLYARALVIKPGDPQITNDLGRLRMRRGVFWMSRGIDPRRFLGETISLVERVTPPEKRRSSCIKETTWFLGCAQWLWGEDPRPALAKARAMFDPHIPETAELSLIEARFLLARGQDPVAPLQAALEDCESALKKQVGPDYYILQIKAEAHCLGAQWAQARAADPSRSIDLGLKALARGLALYPKNAYGLWDKALLEAMRAEAGLVRGIDPSAALAEALRAASQAMSLRPDHFRSTWTLAQVHLADARIRKARGEAVDPALAEARQALDAGFRSNKANFLLHQTLAELELMARRPREAETAAQRGLALKADAIDLWVALARAHRAQAEGGDPAQWAMAREALQKGLALSRAWRPVLDEERRQENPGQG